MSTGESARSCIDCRSYGVEAARAGRSPRCYTHANLRRRWTIARSKARSRGATDYPPYDPQVLVAMKVVVTRERVIALDDLQRALQRALQELIGDVEPGSLDALRVIAQSSIGLSRIVEDLKAAGGIGNPADRGRR